MKKWKSLSCAVAAGFMILTTATPAAYAEHTKSEIQQELQQKEQERKELQKKIDELKKVIQEKDDAIAETEQKLKETEANITETERLILEKEQEIAALEKKIEQREEKLKQRLVALQARPTENLFAAVLFEAKSISDLIDRISSVAIIMQSDKDIMEAQQRDKEAVEEAKELILEKQEELRDFAVKLEQMREQMKNDRAEQQAALTEADNEMQRLVASIAEDNVSLSIYQRRQMEENALYLQDRSNNGYEAPVIAYNGEGNSSIVSRASQYLGVPYVFGGASPRGFDCSGYISYVFGVGRQDVRGYWNSVSRISGSELQPGDLVFFQNTYKPGPSHIGIYVGNGQMIHASPRGIAYSSLSNSYNQRHFLGYGRL